MGTDLLPNTAPSTAPSAAPGRAFARFVRTRDAADFGAAFDATAQDLLLVAARLCPARQAIEDVLQDTWLTALRRAHTYDPSRPLLPWLIGILIHEVRMRRRSERRREVRQNRAIQEEETRSEAVLGRSDPAAAAASVECAEDVAAALSRLDQVHRQVVILRLLHGLSSFEIGRALGRPAHTVRSQLARGLVKLRRLLPAGHGLLATAAFQLDAPGLATVRARLLQTACAKAAAGSLVLTLGVLVVQKFVLAGLAAAAALAVVCFTLWPRADQDGPPAGEGPALSSGVSLAAPPLVPAVASQRAEPAVGRQPAPVQPQTPAADTRMAPVPTLIGRCVDETGRPLSGVTVSVEAPGATASAQRGARVGVAAPAADDSAHGRPDAGLPTPQVTGADGRFALTLPGDGASPLRIRLEAAGRASRHGPALDAGDVPAVDGRIDLGDLVLPAASPVRGRFVDRSGTPQRVPKGHVTARAPETRLDRWPADLQYGGVMVVAAEEFATGPLRHGPWRLELLARGWFCAPVTIAHGPGAEPVTLVVEPVPAIRGVVVDGQDRPVPGVQVSADLRKRIRAMNMMHTVTDRDGRFAIESDGMHAPGERIGLRAGNERLGLAEREVRFGDAEVRLVLQGLRSLLVEVVDEATGRPLAGATLGWSARPQAVVAARHVPATDGTAELTGLPEGPVAVFAVGPDASWRAARTEVTGHARTGRPEQPDLVLRLGRASTQSFRVVQDQAPVSGAKLELIDPLATQFTFDTQVAPVVAGLLFGRDHFALLLGSATTDGEGLARVPLQSERPPQVLRLTPPDGPPTLLSAPFGPGRGTDADPILCAIVAGGAVDLRLRGMHAGQRNVRLILTQGQDRTLCKFPAAVMEGVAPDRDGRARFRRVPAGVWQVRALKVGEAFHPHGAPLALATVSVAAGGHTEAELDAEPLRAARLEAVLAPPRDDPLTLQTLAGATDQVLRELVLDPIAGHVATGDLFPGRYRLVRPADGAVLDLMLRPGETRRGTLELVGR